MYFNNYHPHLRFLLSANVQKFCRHVHNSGPIKLFKYSPKLISLQVGCFEENPREMLIPNTCRIKRFHAEKHLRALRWERRRRNECLGGWLEVETPKHESLNQIHFWCLRDQVKHGKEFENRFQQVPACHLLPSLKKKYFFSFLFSPQYYTLMLSCHSTWRSWDNHYSFNCC